MTPIHLRSRGFTLIELLVVMSIIATLAGLAIVGVPAYLRSADKIKCADNLKSIYQMLMLYETDHRGLPTADGSAFVLAIWGKQLDKTSKGAEVFYMDPHVPRLRGADWPGGRDLVSIDPGSIPYSTFDCVVIVTDHAAFDFDAIRAGARLIVDTRNSIRAAAPHVYKLGAPHPALEELPVG